MTQKKIPKSQEIRYQYTRRLIESGEIDALAANSVTYPPYFTADQYTVATNTTVTYPRFITQVRPECKKTRVQLNAVGNRVTYGGTVVSPVLHSLVYRKAWKKIADDYNNTS